MGDKKKEVNHPGMLYTFHLINGESFESYIYDKDTFKLFCEWEKNEGYMVINNTHMILPKDLIHIEVSPLQK